MRLSKYLIAILLITAANFCVGAQESKLSGNELLLNIKQNLRKPDSALWSLSQVNPVGWSDSLISEYYRLKGSAYFYKGIKDSAVVYFSSAMRLIEDGPCNGHYSLVANGMGVVLHSVQLYDQAIDHYALALTCVEQLNDEPLKLKLFINLSILNREVGNLGESKRFISKAFSLAKSMNDQGSLAAILNTTGQIHLAQQNYDSAYVVFTQSLAFRADDDIKGKAISLNNLGYVAGLRGEQKEALDYYRLAEDLRKKIGDLAGSASIYINMGNIFLEMEDLESAQQYFDNAKIISDRINDPAIHQRYLKSVAALEAAKGNIELSHRLLQDYIRRVDSINQYESIQKIASTPYRIALMEAENLVQSIQDEKQEREASLKRQRLINLGLTIGIAVIIGILALFLYQLRMLVNLRKSLTDERDRAKQSAEHRRRTLNTIVHELRTPMNTLTALTELIEQEKDPAEVQKLTALLNRSAQRLSSTTNNVLTFSRLEDGSLVLSHHPVNLSELLNELCNMMAPQTRVKGLLMERAIAPDVIIQSDRSAIDISMMNIVGNALKYTEEGAIYIGLKQDGDSVTVTVKDTGIGIPSGALEHIYNPFYRAHKDQTKQEGTGLGLYISKYYIDLLGGKISVKSEEDVGTAFEITLPVKKT